MKRQRGVTGLEALAALIAIMGLLALGLGERANAYKNFCEGGGGTWTQGPPASCDKTPWELLMRD